MTDLHNEVIDRSEFAIIEGSVGIREAEHAKEFLTANWEDDKRSVIKVLATIEEHVDKDITHADKEAAARYFSSTPFGKSVPEILAEWDALENSEDGYCHPLWIIFQEHRVSAMNLILNRTGEV